MNINQLNENIPIVDFLAQKGIFPARKYGEECAYFSPIREQEKEPSFMVNTAKNRWYDHALQIGGKLFDLAIRLYPALTMSQLIHQLEGVFSFRQQNLSIKGQPAGEKAGSSMASGEEKKIKILSEGPIQAPALLHYLDTRAIPLHLAADYCKEVAYELYGKQYYALGFPHDGGGYELRNPYFKGSSSPKGITFIDNLARQVAVFEGFFSFLSFLAIQEGKSPVSNYLVLNSIGFFEKSRPVMEKHTGVILLLDRDKAGMKCTQQALNTSPLYKDGSIHYSDHKDLNAYLVAHQDAPQLDLSLLFQEGPNITSRNAPCERINLSTGRGRRI